MNIDLEALITFGKIIGGLITIGGAMWAIENMDLYELNGFKVEVYCPNTTAEILGLDKRISGITSDTLIATDAIKASNIGNEYGVLT